MKFVTVFIMLAMFCASSVIPGDFIICIAGHDHIAIESAGTTHCTDRCHHGDDAAPVRYSGEARRPHIDIKLSVFAGSFVHSPHQTVSVSQHVHSHVSPFMMSRADIPLFNGYGCVFTTGPPPDIVPSFPAMLHTTVITT